MKVPLEEVRRVAALAMVDLDPAGEERLRGHLEETLGYIEKLAEIDTSAVEPAPATLHDASELRQDVVRASLDPAEVLANAPESGEGHFKVPRILPG